MHFDLFVQFHNEFMIDSQIYVDLTGDFTFDDGRYTKYQNSLPKYVFKCISGLKFIVLVLGIVNRYDSEIK